MKKVIEKMSPATQENITKAAEKLATNAPHWVVLLITVGAFLFYLERQDMREMERLTRTDLVAEQRIESCHDVQERSIQVMSNLTEAIGKHDATINDLKEEVERIGRALDRGVGLLPKFDGGINSVSTGLFCFPKE